MPLRAPRSREATTGPSGRGGLGIADRRLVIEAVAERREVKTATFAALDKHLEATDAIIASDTFSLPIMDLAATTNRPESVIGLHFFNPVPVQRLVEVIPTQLTSEEVTERAAAFASGQLGKTVVRARDRSGFVVNALLVPYLISAVRMLESGAASAKDIDGHRAVGGGVHVRRVQGAAVRRSPAAQRMVDAGRLGRKTGSGFYAY